jgi:predicted CoA-binding protein
MTTIVRQAARTARFAGFEVVPARCMATTLPRLATETKLPGALLPPD